MSIVGIIDIPISALNWLLYIILLYSLYVLALQSSSTALTCNRYLCSRENNWEKSGVVAKFWQFSSGLILQNKTWINDCSFESESWQVIYNRENKNMSGSADAFKKNGVSALFFITYLQVKGCQGHYTVLHDRRFAKLMNDKKKSAFF